jgi:hypothetical protein
MQQIACDFYNLINTDTRLFHCRCRICYAYSLLPICNVHFIYTIFFTRHLTATFFFSFIGLIIVAVKWDHLETLLHIFDLFILLSSLYIVSRSRTDKVGPSSSELQKTGNNPGSHRSSLDITDEHTL